MTKMIVEIPDPLHRLVKTFAGANGETIKSVVTRAIENMLTNEAGINAKNKYLSEEQADEMLKPVILKYADQIKKGTFEGFDKKEFFEQLKK